VNPLNEIMANKRWIYELNAAIDAILANTDPAKRNVVRAWIRVVIASAKMIHTDEVFEKLNKVVAEQERK
jgi:hypothetical protein